VCCLGIDLCDILRAISQNSESSVAAKKLLIRLALDDKEVENKGGRRVPYTDKTLTCVDCGADFTFSAEDQEYHASRGFTNEPKRCANCRQARKAERGGSRGGGGYGSSQRQMYPAVCAECGQNTEVPFEPRGDRPVYCLDCFSKRSSTRGGY
jgi:CxxC-x17-CxxC domain-containing protein